MEANKQVVKKKKSKSVHNTEKLIKRMLSVFVIIDNELKKKQQKTLVTNFRVAMVQYAWLKRTVCSNSLHV